MQVESNSLVRSVEMIVNYFYVSFFGKFLLACWCIIIIIKCMRWLSSGTNSFLEFSEKSYLQRQKSNKTLIEDRIDERVRALDELKMVEVKIREELDKMHEVKDISDKNKGIT